MPVQRSIQKLSLAAIFIQTTSQSRVDALLNVDMIRGTKATSMAVMFSCPSAAVAVPSPLP
jgi:hypothetical protein